jgi:hypothetical protein
MYNNLYSKGLLLFISLTLFACQTNNSSRLILETIEEINRIRAEVPNFTIAN